MPLALAFSGFSFKLPLAQFPTCVLPVLQVSRAAPMPKVTSVKLVILACETNYARFPQLLNTCFGKSRKPENLLDASLLKYTERK